MQDMAVCFASLWPLTANSAGRAAGDFAALTRPVVSGIMGPEPWHRPPVGSPCHKDTQLTERKNKKKKGCGAPFAAPTPHPWKSLPAALAYLSTMLARKRKGRPPLDLLLHNSPPQLRVTHLKAVLIHFSSATWAFPGA